MLAVFLNSSAQGASWKMPSITVCSRFAFTSRFARFTPCHCTDLPRTWPGAPWAGTGGMLLVPEECRVRPSVLGTGRDRGKGKAQGQSSVDSKAGGEAKPKAWLRVGVWAFNPAYVGAPGLQFREIS